MADAYLEWTDEGQRFHRVEVIDRLCIGRTCKGLDTRRRILLDNPLVSRDHAEITLTAGFLKITDTSSNGTWVNNVRMAAGSSKDLADGDVIRIDNSLLQIVYSKTFSGDAPDSAATEMTRVASLEEVVTSLVADLRGFSTYSQGHASSDVYGVVREVFEKFSSIVEEFRGTIKDYAGDAIFAFWEHQYENSATQSLRACRAALQQCRIFSQILKDLTGRYADIDNLQMGWGITTGPIYLAHFGSRTADLAMIGDSVNLASRLSGMANKDIPENILICSSTAAHVQNQITTTDLGRFPIRGRKGREQVFALSAA
jgi:class 3 adenylate cyclase